MYEHTHQRLNGKSKAIDGVPSSGLVTPLASWVTQSLKDYAENAMPDASWDDVLHLALSTGIGALTAMTRHSSPTLRMEPPVVSPIVTWQENVYRVLLAEIARVGAPLVVDAEDISELAVDYCKTTTNRVVGGRFSKYSSASIPMFGLRVESVGRALGQRLHMYRLTAVPA
jgi:hypothetical protein